jgi:hypothetical protein
MRRRFGILLAASVLGLGLIDPLPAPAQPAPPPIADEAVKQAVQLALKNIERAVCDGFNPCTAATPEELRSPPVSLDQARAAMVTGTRTALANWCGLDGNRRSVLPMTQHLRKLRFSNRQVALMAVIHGIQQSVVSEQLQAKGTCDAETRGRIDAQLPKT